MDINELLNKIATPGDVAAAGIGFDLGLPLVYVYKWLGVLTRHRDKQSS